MKYFPILFLIVLTLLFSSCAKNIVTNYQDNSENTGKLVIIPNKPIFNASITLQNQLYKGVNKLIVNHKNIKTLEIRNIPEGIYGMELIYNNNDLSPIKNNEFTVRIQKDKTTSKLIQIPPPSFGSYLLWTALIIALIFIPPGPPH